VVTGGGLCAEISTFERLRSTSYGPGLSGRVCKEGEVEIGLAVEEAAAGPFVNKDEALESPGK
jgi:hypothetical protein